MVRQQAALRSHDPHGAAVDCLDDFISYLHRNPIGIDFAYKSVPACVSHNYDSGFSCRDVTSGANILRPDAAPEGKDYAEFSFHAGRYLLIC
jgi:hypothetical protein